MARATSSRSTRRGTSRATPTTESSGSRSPCAAGDAPGARGQREGVLRRPERAAQLLAQRPPALLVERCDVGAARADAALERRPQAVVVLVGRAHAQLSGRDLLQAGLEPQSLEVVRSAVAHDAPLVVGRRALGID